MRISRIRVQNFRNLSSLDFETDGSLVIVGENKSGKSNLLYALRLVLDPALSERDRTLDLNDFWDGLHPKIGSTIEITVDVTDFEASPILLAHLGDHLIQPGPPMVSRLGYRFQPKASRDQAPATLADYESVLFGGAAERPVPNGLRRALPLDVYGALRDAERDLSTWRRSPLRPLVERLDQTLDGPATELVLNQLTALQTAFTGQAAVSEIADRITDRLNEMAGEQHGTTVALGLASFKRESLLRELQLLIDGGSRGISNASSGTANLIFLALKSLELNLLVEEGERDHTFLGVEEPEAHLHPHVQRLIYRYLLGALAAGRDTITPILTTHSPHIASVAPVRSIVLMRRGTDGAATANSAAKAPLARRDVDDLQRYIDVTRGEMFFARGVIFVEGDAERFLIPMFAAALNIDLDELGVTVSSVAGTNFMPYAKVLGTGALKIPFVVITDRDPRLHHPSYGKGRVEKLLGQVAPGPDYAAMTEEQIFVEGAAQGIFVNGHTLEVDLFRGTLAAEMKDILTKDLGLNAQSQATIQGWIDLPATLEVDKLLKVIERLGKGRFAQSLAVHLTAGNCPPYIRAALERIRDAVAQG